MNETIQVQTREHIKEFLPATLRKALSSYHQFVDKDDFATDKDFSKHHMACKVAISHIELLIKLSRLAYTEEEASMDPVLMEAAQRDIKNFYNPLPQDDDDLA